VLRCRRSFLPLAIRLLRACSSPVVPPCSARMEDFALGVGSCLAVLVLYCVPMFSDPGRLRNPNSEVGRPGCPPPRHGQASREPFARDICHSVVARGFVILKRALWSHAGGTAQLSPALQRWVRGHRITQSWRDWPDVVHLLEQSCPRSLQYEKPRKAHLGKSPTPSLGLYRGHSAHSRLRGNQGGRRRRSRSRAPDPSTNHAFVEGRSAPEGQFFKTSEQDARRGR